MADPLLDDLDPRQRDAVTIPAAPLAILAPAGSGKTRVLTRRIAWRVRSGSADARHVLAVTFTRNAATELRSRLARLGVDDGSTAGTFHALALAQLRRRALEQGRPAPTVVASKARLLAPLLSDGERAPAAVVGAVATEIEWAKARGVTPDRFAAAARAAGRRPPAGIGDVPAVYAAYEREKRRRGLSDFDDLLSGCADAIGADAEFAAAQRWRFRHLFVDEFQDATPLQVRLLRAWLGDRSDLCVVGDVAQSIYGFAGADAAPLAEFGRHFPGATVVELDRNHRSTPQVVAMAEAALGSTSGIARPGVRSTRDDGAPPTVRAYDDELDEARGVADDLWRRFADGVPWRSMAVLFRTNAQSAAFEAACTRRAVPWRRPAADALLARPATRVLLRHLGEVARGAPGMTFADLLAELAATEVARGDAAEAGDVEATRGDAAVPPPLVRADDAVSDEDLVAAHATLLRLGRDYLTTERDPGSIDGFRSWLTLAARDEVSGGDGVELLTFHRAKGLEWPVVFVTGIEQGLVPIAGATTDAGRAEERRLLHVALGRATDELHLSWARTRVIGGRRRERAPSPWLPALEAGARAHAVEPRDPREHVAGIRAALASASPPAPRRRDQRHR